MKEIFKIFRINAADADKIQQSDNRPHLHDFEELIIGLTGELEHFIDFRAQRVEAPFVSFVTKGKVHRLEPIAKEGRLEMWVS